MPIILSFFVSFFNCIYAEPPSGQTNAAPQAAPQAAARKEHYRKTCRKHYQCFPESDGRTQALTSAGAAWEHQDPHAAMEWAFTLQNDKSGFNVVKAMANDWGSREPIPATTEWVMGHSPKDGQLTFFALHLISTAWARVDPSAANAWAEKQPETNGVRRIAYYSVADGWAQKDPPSAAAWAEKIPGEADRHVALPVVAGLWATKSGHPEIAAAWAEKLPVGDMKYVVPRIANTWAKTDATKAKAWVNGLPLADADKADILGKIK